MTREGVAAALLCFIWPLSARSSSAESPPENVPSNYIAADGLFDDIQAREADFARNCIEDLTQRAADLDARLKGIDRELERNLGKRPNYKPYPAEVESLVCDQRVPYIKVAKFLIGLDARERPEFAQYAIHAINQSRLTAIKYYSCLAAAKNDASACEPLKEIPSSLEHVPANCAEVSDGRTQKFLGEAALAVERCRRNRNAVLLAKALMTADSATAERLCLDICRRDGAGAIFSVDKELAEVESCATVCSLAVRHREEPERFCAEALPAVKGHPAAVKACRDKKFSTLVGLGNGLSEAQMLAMFNDPDWHKHPCAPSQPCFDRQDVLAYSSFRTAFRAKDRTLCGDSIKCRVMMGEGPQICEPIAASVRAEVCGEREKLVKRQEWDRARAAAAERISRMQAALARRQGECSGGLNEIKAMHDKIGELLSRPPEYPGKEARAQRLELFWRRFTAIDKKLSELRAFPPAAASP